MRKSCAKWQTFLLGLGGQYRLNAAYAPVHSAGHTVLLQTGYSGSAPLCRRSPAASSDACHVQAQITKIAVAPAVLVLEFALFRKRSSLRVMAAIALVRTGRALTETLGQRAGALPLCLGHWSPLFLG